MRTTLTIDDHIAIKLRQVQKSEPNKSFKVVVNETLMRGLQTPPNSTPEPFVVKSRHLGIANRFDLDNIEEALDVIEGKDRKW